MCSLAGCTAGGLRAWRPSAVVMANGPDNALRNGASFLRIYVEKSCHGVAAVAVEVVVVVVVVEIVVVVAVVMNTICASLMAGLAKIPVFLDVTLCCWASGFRRFGGFLPGLTDPKL